MTPASILLEKAKFDPTFNRFDEKASDYDLAFDDGQQCENIRLIPLIEAAVKIIEVQAKKLVHHCSCPQSLCIRKTLRKEDFDSPCMCGLDEAQAKVQEILKGIE